MLEFEHLIEFDMNTAMVSLTFEFTFIWRYFQPGRDNQTGLDDFCSAFLSMDYVSGFKNFFLLTETADKTALPNSMFKFISSFLVLV